MASLEKIIQRFRLPFLFTLYKEKVQNLKEWMKLTLINLGFTKAETEVYMFLTTQSPKTAKEIAKTQKRYTPQINRILKKLQLNGTVDVSTESPARFSAVNFQKVLELLAQTKKEQHNMLIASKEDLMSTWKAMTEKNKDKN
jgi:sugar-specific transcriptional regulator TrmB